ncbi:MAG: flippase [Balneolaceae bacterium]
MNLLSPVLNNISWHLIYRIARLSLAFFISAWVARYLGPEEYGQLVYAVAISEVIMLFWSQGLKEVVIQQIRENKSNNKDEPIAAFQLMILGNTILLGVLSILLYFLELTNTIRLLSILCGIGIWFRAFEAFELWFHSELNVKVTVLIQFLSQLVYATANISLILNNASLLWFGVTYLGQLAITGIGFLLVYRKFNSIKLVKIYFPIQKEIVLLGSFMIIAHLTLKSSFLLDRFVIEKLLNIESVGIYTAAMKLITVWVFISKAISLSVLPVLTDEKFSIKFNLLSQKMFSWTLMISIVLTFVFSNFSTELVSLIYGSKFTTTSDIFKILGFALPFLFLNEGIKASLIIKNKTKYYIFSMVLVSSTYLVLNFILIPIFGLVGSAYSFLISWFIGGFMYLLVFEETRPLFIIIMKSIFSPIHYLTNTLINKIK